MMPLDAAMRVYSSEPCARSFAEDLAIHLRHGYVISTPSFFAMIRPVDSSASRELVLDPMVTWRPSDCDCWFIWCLAGDMREAIEYLPFPLRYVAYQRKNYLRFNDYSRIHRLATHTHA